MSLPKAQTYFVKNGNRQRGRLAKESLRATKNLHYCSNRFENIYFFCNFAQHKGYNPQKYKKKMT